MPTSLELLRYYSALFTQVTYHCPGVHNLIALIKQVFVHLCDHGIK